MCSQIFSLVPSLVNTEGLRRLRFGLCAAILVTAHSPRSKTTRRPEARSRPAVNRLEFSSDGVLDLSAL
jgi:hypothetical protein